MGATETRRLQVHHLIRGGRRRSIPALGIATTSLGFLVKLFVWSLAVGLPSVLFAKHALRKNLASRVALGIVSALLSILAWASFTDLATGEEGSFFAHSSGRAVRAAKFNRYASAKAVKAQ